MNKTERKWWIDVGCPRGNCHPEIEYFGKRGCDVAGEGRRKEQNRGIGLMLEIFCN